MAMMGAPMKTPSVAADQPAGAGDGDGEVLRDLREQAHDDELGGADGEGA